VGKKKKKSEVKMRVMYIERKKTGKIPRREKPDLSMLENSI